MSNAEAAEPVGKILFSARSASSALFVVVSDVDCRRAICNLQSEI